MILVQILTSITIILIPAYIVRCRFFALCQQISPIPLTLLEVMIIATLLSWVVWRLYLLKNKKQKLLEPFQGLSKPILTAIGVFLLAGLISIFISEDLRAAAGIFKAYLIESVLLSLVVYDLSKKKNSVNWVVLPLIISGLWVAGLAIYQQFTINSVTTSGLLNIRISSIYSTPNAVGLYLGPLFFVILGLILNALKSKKSTNKVQVSFLLLSAIIFLSAIVFSGSRGSLAGILVGSIFFGSYLVYLNSRTNLKNIVNKAFIVIVILFLVGNSLLIANVSSSDNFLPSKSYFSTLNSRFCLWEKSRDIIADRPFFGIGLSNFEDISKDYTVCKTNTSLYPHNIFLNFWLELGMLGLLSFLALIFLSWVDLNRLKGFFAAGLMAAIVYIFVHGIVDVPYFKNDLSSQFWVLFAVAMWLIYSKKSNPG